MIDNELNVDENSDESDIATEKGSVLPPELEIVARQIQKIVNTYRSQRLMGQIYNNVLANALLEGRVFTEMQDNDVVGFALFETSWRRMPFYFLDKIAVSESVLGIGVGYKLLKRVIDTAAAEDKSVILRVAETNTRAIDFYKRAGFEIWEDRFGKASRSVELKLCIKFLRFEHKYNFTQKWSERPKLADLQTVKTMTTQPEFIVAGAHGTVISDDDPLGNLIVDEDPDTVNSVSKVGLMELKIDHHNAVGAKSTTETVIKRNLKQTNLARGGKRDPTRYGSDYIVEWNGQPLTVAYLSSIPVSDREEIAQYLFKYFREGGFPYPEYTNEELEREFSSLKMLDTDKCLSGKHLSSALNVGSKIFRHFNPHFWHTRELKGKSVFEVFESDELLMKVIRNRLGITFFYRGVSYPFDISGNMIRQGIRSMRLAPQITNFRPSVMKFMCDKWIRKEKGVVLDYSVGFNQRLIGAVSSERVSKYIGIDPWTETIAAGRKIVDYFNLSDKVDLIESGSETADLSMYKGQVDLAFSSPPYYTKEVYSSDPSQAYSNRTYKEFISNYWIPTAANVAAALKPDGIFAINICRGSKKESMHYDMVNAIKMQGFEVIEEYEMTYQKSHLSDKVGKDSLKEMMKSDPITVLRRMP